MPLLLPLSGFGSGTLAFPDLYLEWAPTTNPTAPPVWERIPLSDIRSIDINRGRSRELDQMQAGRMTVVLDNRDRTYDPLGDGPYAGGYGGGYAAGYGGTFILPNRRIRLIAVYDNSYYLFSGYVDNWRQQWENPLEATVTVTATDGFKVLQRADLASSAYAQEVSEDGPISWWRLGDAAGATTVTDVVGDADLAVTGTPTFGTTGLVSRDSDTAMTVTATTNTLKRSGRLWTTGPLTIELLYKGTATTSAMLFGQEDGNRTNMVQLVVGLSDTQFAVTTDTGGSGIVTGAAISDDTTHHVVGVWESDGTVRLYIDGVSQGTPVVVTAGTFDEDGPSVFGVGLINPSNTARLGVYDEIAAYDVALSAARIAAHSAEVATPWNGDTSGERIDRVLDAVRWPDADRDVDTGESTLQSAELNMTALAHAQQVTDTEYGELFMTPDGKVRFMSRTTRWSQTTPAATFSDDGADTGYTQVAADYSDQQIRNRVTISRNEGLSFTANSTSSQDQFFIQSYSRTGLLHDNDVESRDRANYVLATYKDPLFRFDQLTVKPQKTPATWFPVVLGLDLVDRVNVERTPQSVGSAIDDNFVIEGIRHSIRPKQWETSFYVSPADDPGGFILDSTVSGILDTNRLGF